MRFDILNNFCFTSFAVRMLEVTDIGILNSWSSKIEILNT